MCYKYHWRASCLRNGITSSTSNSDISPSIKLCLHFVNNYTFLFTWSLFSWNSWICSFGLSHSTCQGSLSSLCFCNPTIKYYIIQAVDHSPFGDFLSEAGAFLSGWLSFHENSEPWTERFLDCLVSREGQREHALLLMFGMCILSKHEDENGASVCRSVPLRNNFNEATVKTQHMGIQVHTPQKK